jgi:hypothetical protein
VAMLDIVLTDGFDDDRVTVAVDGHEVFSEAVSTDQRIGVARAVEPVERSGPVVLEVRMPGRDRTVSAAVDPGSDRVEVAYLDGEIQLAPSTGQAHGHA